MARSQSGGDAHSPLCSPRNTSLNFLSGFPKSPPADMMELEERLPPQPRDLPDRRCSNRLTKRAREGRAPSSLGPLQGPAAEQGWRAGLLSRQVTVPAASPRSRLAPSEARGWVGKEGGVGRSQRCARRSRGQRRFVLSTPHGDWGERRRVAESEPQTSGTSYTHRLSSYSCRRRRSPTC